MGRKKGNRSPLWRAMLMILSVGLASFSSIAGTQASDIPSGSFSLQESWMVDTKGFSNPGVDERLYEDGSTRVWVLFDEKEHEIGHLKAPKLKRGQEFNRGECRVGGGEVRWDIIAMVVHRPNQEWTSKVIRAWRIVPGKGSGFVEFPPKNVSCRNIAFGVDVKAK
jgi:hypothetical protein